METVEINGDSYVTAEQLQKEYKIGRATCWRILSKGDGIRKQKFGNMMFYSYADCLCYFSHLITDKK